ncbi:MAG: 3-deoxy-manno-octulosonate cytidylyltransferase [gamma proteobacterium symbiont of Lucinoma myriamae]|nr:3-deoxy-manno-octulosonate cytidylyltransferase [gamma proteobacterium symbiont of Lucinoma myriamae]MCU7817837.1 3-deoxy-manno-octulosonate cytidylyltransferase [gamma proteobacterium symbiont of Lucinoma myriamae]MCU7833165.1 3-deoxy-manno-octulosonate cytidylyltransferase [gamma proteobacterium symbiont of Lucinoma myriamae]
MKKTDFKIVIPARYASSRLPGKPLRLISGKPMIQHTYERALQSQAEEVVIAIDDQRIIDVASQFTNNIVMTSPDHASGTERLAEVLALKNWDDNTIIVNVQGDEPLVAPAHIELVAESLKNNIKAGMATLATPINDLEDVFDPNVVKVVMDHQGYALYFSRAALPWSRDSFTMNAVEQQAIKTLTQEANWYRHIGMYAYRGTALQQYMTLQPCMLEKTESLEQLRVLYNGIGIHVSIVHEDPGHGVDVEADIEKVELLLTEKC